MTHEVVTHLPEPVEQSSARALPTSLALAALALMAALLFVAPAPPAAAAGSPQISVSPSSGLNPDGDFVMVSGSGFKPNIKLFVMQCRNNSGEDHTCNSIGLQKVDTDGAGNFSTRRPVSVSANMGATDCRSTPCAIKTSAVSGHAGDRSQDVLASISFAAPAAPVAAAPEPTTPPATQAPAAPAPAAEAPVTAPPTTEVPTTTTAAPTTTTTTEAQVTTTTTTEVTAETTVSSSPGKANELAVGADGPNGPGESGSSPVPWIVAGFVVVLGAVGGAIYTARARAAR